MSVPFIEENDQTRARHEHLEALRRLVGNVYPNKFERSQIAEAGREDTITSIVAKFHAFEPQVLEGGRSAPEEIELANQQLNGITVRLAGRIASPPRVMGKAAFVHLADGTSRLQTYVRKADIRAVNNDTGWLIKAEGKGWELFGLLDHGDFIGVEGYLFITRTGELSVHVQTLRFLAKALLPLPDKMHGINDPEIRQRQRYADLIAGSLKLEREENELTPREVFERRAAVVRELRRILDDHGYIEVETPMLTPKATGAAAKPFKTHHNALDIDLYARIAPELYLKRLLVGGFEKVYELNRNFRNEGISARHNPEFTMLEFYWAYADVNQMMDFCESMLRATAFKALGHTHAQFGEHSIDFSQPFQRMTMKEAIITHWPSVCRKNDSGEVQADWLDDLRLTRLLARFVGANYVVNTGPDADLPEYDFTRFWLHKQADAETQKLIEAEAAKTWQWVFDDNRWSGWMASWANGSEQTEIARLTEYIFGAVVEKHLVQPTLITSFPKPISPLSKASPTDPTVAERFELYIVGMECANGFSELNDPEEQYQRFNDQEQQRERGDDEAMVMDEDYIRALSYGMPPAAGIGIGIDRFVMLLTNRQSIRDVILFPHMRPERKRDAMESESEPPAIETV